MKRGNNLRVIASFSHIINPVFGVALWRKCKSLPALNIEYDSLGNILCHVLPVSGA